MRRALRISVWAAGGLALALALLCAMLFIAGNTAAGRTMIENTTRRLTSGQVSLEGLAGSFPSHLTLQQLQLRDREGVWLRAERIALDWSPLALLSRRIDVGTVHAARVDMQRLPVSSSNAQGGTVSIPRIDVGDLTVDRVDLGPRLTGSAASLVLHGTAHLRSLLDMVIDAEAHRIDGDGDYRLQLSFDAQRMDAALSVHEPAGGPLENLLHLPGLGALAATVTLNGPRVAERLDVSIDAGTLRGTARGSFDLKDLSADLLVDLDSPALAPRPDLSWERASLHGRWQGPVRSPKAQARVEIDQLRLPGASSLASLRGDLEADSGTAALHAVLEGLRIPGRRPQLLEDAPVKLDASLRLDATGRPLEVSLAHRLFALHATAETAAASDGVRNAGVELRLPDLAPWAALGGQSVEGSALVKAQLRNDGDGTHVALDAGAALRVGTQAWSRALGDSASLQASGVVTASAVQILSLKLTGRAVSLSASGEVSRDPAASVKAHWDLGLPDLAVLSPAFAGTLKGSGTLQGPADSLGAQAQLTSTLSVRNSASGTVDLTAKVEGLPSIRSGSLVAQGNLEGAPLQLDVAMERKPGGGLHAVVRRADWKSAHADGELSIAPETTQSHGQLRFQIARLADLQDLAGTTLGGSLAGSVAVRPDGRVSRADMQLDARDATFGGYAGALHLSAQGPTTALAFNVDAQSSGSAVKTTVSANGSLNLDARQILVTAASGTYREQPLQLLGAARISLANGVSVDAVRIGAGQGVLQFGGQFTPALDLHASLTGVGPALVNGFLPGTLSSGAIEAHAELQGSVAHPTGQVHVTASDLRMADDSALGLPAVDLRASAQLQGDASQIDAKLLAGTASQLSLTGRAPLAAGGALDLLLRGNLDIGLINPLLEAHGQHAAGDLTVNAAVTGDAASPQIDGSVKVAGGSIRDYSRGLSLTDIVADIVGSEGTLKVKSLTARAAPGTVSMTGTIGVLQAGLPVDLEITARKAQPLVSKLVTANLDADLRLRGTARDRLDLDGTVHLNRTVIGIPNSLPPNVAVLDVRRRSQPAAPAPARPLIIGMDITVQAPQEILVQGRGLDAEMGGDLHLGGTTDAPLVTGGFDLQRGNFSLAGAKLNFTAGRVSFNGAGLKNKIDPTLDFTAQTTVSDTTATLQITGLADAPQFVFTSTPAKPQDEIMALLLFGATPQQLSALQLAQIGAVLASLSGVGGDSGLNPLVKLQKSLGLDRLTVGSGTTNTPTGPQNAGAAIEAGRYISKRVYVEAKQSTTGNSQVEADIDLTKHLKLQTRVGNGTGSVLGTTPENDPGSSVGLSYQFEY